MKKLAVCLALTAAGCTKAPEIAQAKAPAKTVEEATPAPQTPLKVGDATPDLTLTLHDGTSFALADHAEAFVFVYFYPKDDTPGCTVEAQGLRDNYAALTSAGVKVIGVSLQDATSHKAFIEAHDLPFPLAVDDGSAAKAFDVPVRGEYAARHSFLMKGGKVVAVWRKVSPAEHAQEVLQAAKTGA